MSPRTGRVRQGRISRLAAPVLLCLLVSSRATSAPAQEPVRPDLSGQVVLGTEPLRNAMVVLHQVSADRAGEVDSIQAGPDGAFTLTLPHVPDPESRGEVFFASVRHQGILYFGPPINQAVQLDSAYLIQAYDTATAPAGGADVPVRVRNLFIEGDPTGWRATDLIQIGNSGTRTLVPRDGDVTWTYPMPTGAGDFELGQGDFSLEQVAFTEGRLTLTAPLPPGDRLLVVRYRLDGLSTAIAMPGLTERAEVLIREPAPPLTVSGLEQVASVELEPGQTYRRFLGAELAGAPIMITPSSEEPRLPLEWLAVGLGLVLTVAALVAFRSKERERGRPAHALPGPLAPPDASAENERARILLEIARLDESHGEGSGVGDGDYRDRREALVDRLRGADG